ncbi:MAG: hypothetical protein HC822_21360 [Oscillochloris sp.]|nr:hypothetical protein [Oscillochloris sp.]
MSTVIEPGNYAIRIQIADVTTVLPLRVTNPDDATRLTIARNNAALNLRAEANGSALADVEVDWSLRLEPVAIPAELHEFSFNPQPEPQVLSGSARTNAEGRLEIPLPQADPPGLRYRFSAEINTLDGRNASADAIGLLAPTAVTLGLHLPQRIVLTDERATVELASIATTGEAERGQSITIEVFPSAASDGAPLLVRRTVSDSRGRAAVQLVPLRPGAYIVRAEASDATTETTLYVAGNAYAGWTNAPGEVAIITDRTVYQPGDVARLLVTSPFTTATLLLTQERDDLRDYAVLPLQAGRLITLTVTPDMAPAISLGALLAGDELRVGATELRVGTETPVLTLTVAADRPTYLPEATAALTVTINDDQGPAAADLLLSISPDDGLADAVDPARRAFAPPAPAGLSVALPGAPLAPLSPPVPPAVIPGALVPLRAGAGALGTFTARVELPDQPGRWRISAYAFDNGGLIALDTTVITTELPLEVEPFAAPVIRPDDRAGAGLILRSTSATTSTVRIDVIADQALIDRRTLLNRTVVLAPGAEQRLTWMISDAEGPQATLRIQVAAGDYRTERSLSILVAGAADPVAFAERTASDVAGLRLSEWISAGAELEIQIAPNLRAALADSVSAERSENRITDRAAHLLIATQLGSSGDTAVRERWRLEALQAWNELTAGQNSDGGWGWWPGSPSSPFISAFAVEAQAAGGRFLGSERSTSLRALAYLERVAPQAEPNLRAYIAYVLRQAGRPSNDLLFELPIDELNRAGLAFAALSLSDAEAETALDRLLALVDRASADTPPLAGLPRDQLSSAAATVQALQARRPGTPALELNRERIRASWGVAGWSSAYAAARVAMALQPVSVPTPPPIQQITLGDQIIAAGPVTTTLRFTIPAAAANTLNIATPPNSEPLIAVRTPETPPEDSTPLLVDLIAANGETLDPARLRNGDSLTMSLLLIVTEPILGAELEIALPAAFELLPTSVPTPFDHLGERRDQRIVRLTAATLMPGVYRVQLPLHIISFGRFNAPPPRLQSQYDNKRPQYARQPLVIRVQP